MKLQWALVEDTGRVIRVGEAFEVVETCKPILKDDELTGREAVIMFGAPDADLTDLGILPIGEAMRRKNDNPIKSKA